MTLTHVPFDQFESKLWKNGLGTTYDIALFPKGADHADFDLRFALSPIVENNVFSAFPGIERVITPVEGAGLRLEFAEKEHELVLNQSLRFDSALTPMGKPRNGAIKVINVMARREKWNFLSCGVTEQDNYVLQDGEYLLLFALQNCVVRSDDENVLMAKHDAVLASSARTISINAPEIRILHAHLQVV